MEMDGSEMLVYMTWQHYISHNSDPFLVFYTLSFYIYVPYMYTGARKLIIYIPYLAKNGVSINISDCTFSYKIIALCDILIIIREVQFYGTDYYYYY